MKVIFLCLSLSLALAAPQSLPRFKRGLGRIAGGTDVSPGEAPYQLSLRDTSFGINFHFCGASIHSDEVAICSGTCVYGEDSPENLQIVAGDLNINVDEGIEQARDIAQIVLHENYNSLTYDSDISLLFFDSPLVFNCYISAVPLPAQNQEFTGDAVVTGWGEDTYTLQKVTVPIVDDESCRESYGAAGVGDSMICAGEEGKGFCQGDSGGPLVCEGFLCGIASWSYGCAEAGYPGVYTEVAYFVDWIEANVPRMNRPE